MPLNHVLVVVANLIINNSVVILIEIILEFVNFEHVLIQI